MITYWRKLSGRRELKSTVGALNLELTQILPAGNVSGPQKINRLASTLLALLQEMVGEGATNGGWT